MSRPKRAVFISGCDSGFGKALVGKLEKLEGFLVFAGVLTEAGKALYEGKKDVVPVSLDVTSDQSVQQAVELVKRELAVRSAVFYGLVNNAGILLRPAPTEWQEVSNYEKMCAVNVFGVVRLTNAFLPMIRQNKGRIIIVASIAGRVGLASNSAYCASKYAVTGYAEVLRRDMLQWEVPVVVIEPGIFSQTGLYSDFQKGLDKTWQGLSDDIRKDYGEALYKRQRMVLGFVLKGYSNPDPDVVPQTMVEALISTKPKRRYRCGQDSNTFFRALPLMPDSWVDSILTRPGDKPVFPSAAKQTPVKGGDLYADDMVATAVACGAIGLSTVGVLTLGRAFGRALL